MLFIAYLVLFLSYLNLVRLAVFLIGSDIYDIKQSLKRKKLRMPLESNSRYRPLVSVLVPAHNEEN
jgi:cellulose synthase/poly-beta-1,6-N-acetylglucosamine synthase-like glycosyltransferase